MKKYYNPKKKNVDKLKAYLDKEDIKLNGTNKFSKKK